MKYLVKEGDALIFKDDNLRPSNFYCHLPESFVPEMMDFMKVKTNSLGERYAEVDLMGYALWNDARLAKYNSSLLAYKVKKDSMDSPLGTRIYRGIFGSFIETVIIGIFKNHLKKLLEAFDNKFKR